MKNLIFPILNILLSGIFFLKANNIIKPVQQEIEFGDFRKYYKIAGFLFLFMGIYKLCKILF